MHDELEERPEGEPTARDWRSFWALVAMQVQNAFNDNMAKFILLPLGAWLVARGEGFKGIEHLLSGLLVLPFILFAPSSGWIADRFPKHQVIRFAAWLQLVILGLMVGALYCQSLGMAVGAFFLLASQATLLSPAKMGIVKELLGARKLAYASGMMEGTVILAILAGMIVGGMWFDRGLASTGSGWSAALVPVAVLWAGGLLAIVSAHRIQATRASMSDGYSLRIAFRHFRDLGEVWRQRRLRQAALGVAFFWGFAGFISLVVVQIAKELHGGGVGTGATNSKLMTAASVGIALGSIVAGRMSRRGIELGLAPVGALIMSAGVFALALSEPASWFQYAMLVVGGAGGAIFLVPLNACVLDWPAEAERGKVVSVSNLMNNTFGIAAVALQFLLETAGMPVRWQFFAFGLITLGVTMLVVRRLPMNFVRLIGLAVVRSLYHVRALGAEHVPASGGVLLLPNHVSFADAFFLSAASPRPVRFLIDEGFYRRWWVGGIARLFGSVPISRGSTRAAIQQVGEALAAGHVVCVFPEGRLTRTGFVNEIKRGYELMAKKGNAVIVPAYMDGVWGSIFSFERGRFVWKRPYRIPYRITVAFRPVLALDEASPERLRLELLEGAAATLESRRDEARGLVRRVFAGELPAGLGEFPAVEREQLAFNLLQIANTNAWGRRTTLWVCPELAVPALRLVHAYARAFGCRVASGLPPEQAGQDPQVVIGGAALRARLVGRRGLAFYDLEALEPDAQLAGQLSHCPCLLAGGRMLAMSTPEPPPAPGDVAAQPGARAGSVGRLLPGFVWTLDGGELVVGGPALGGGVGLGAGVRLDAEGFVFWCAECERAELAKGRGS